MKREVSDVARPWFRIIGDVHGLQSQYTGVANKAEYSLQVGDVGFDYKWIRRNLDAERHKIIAGNHDNYAAGESGKFIRQTDHFLGDFGIYEVPEFGAIFFVRGGQSIDRMYRKEGRDWWPAEELTYQQGLAALQLYEEAKPDFVVTHECPTSIIEMVSTMRLWDGVPIRPSSTAHLLQSMLEIHQPEWWVFGHHHKNWRQEINGTIFRCVAELSYVDFDKVG